MPLLPLSLEGNLQLIVKLIMSLTLTFETALDYLLHLPLPLSFVLLPF